MAIIKKKAGSLKKSSTPVKSKTKSKSKPSVALPTEKNVPSNHLGDYSWLLYGFKGVGKTTLAAEFPDAFIMSFEPGTKALDVYTSPVETWAEFVAFIDLIIEGDHNFKTIAIDTADLMYDSAYDFVCERDIIASPTENNDFGATWREIRKMVRTQVNRLLKSDYGVMFLSHETEKGMERSDGSEYQRIQPSMAKQALQEIEGLCDIVAHYTYVNEHRAIVIRGNQSVAAKARPKYNFLVAGKTSEDSDYQVIAVDGGKSEGEAYDNLVSAFNNEQEYHKPDFMLKSETEDEEEDEEETKSKKTSIKRKGGSFRKKG